MAFYPARDAVSTARAIRAREISPVEFTEETIARIRDTDREVNSFTCVLEEEALEQASRAERAVLEGEDLGPLHGVPVSVKDVIWVKGAPATNGSRALREYVPDQDAIIVSRLRAAGAIVVGKTNNPELCLAGITDNHVFGLTRNPWDLDRTPGGSSGGAGASLSLGLTPLALGSDGGGSIRIPASFCGIAGFKPTYGLLPSTPGFRGWKTLSVKGPMARTVRDLAVSLSVMSGFHPSDETSLVVPPADYLVAAKEGCSGDLRIAYSADLGFASVEPAVRVAFGSAIEAFASAGWSLEESHPPTGDATELWKTISACEGYGSHRRFLENHKADLEPRTVDVISRGSNYAAADYIEAIHERAAFASAWLEFFERYDLLLTPTMQLTAFGLGSYAPNKIAGRCLDPARDDWCAFCYPANLTGQPALSLPCGFDECGLPIGLQIMGRRFEEGTVLRAAAAFETIKPWAQHWPIPETTNDGQGGREMTGNLPA